MIEINFEWAVELLEAEVDKESPGFVYAPPDWGTGCVNTVATKDGIFGSCLIGRMLIAAGVDAARLHLVAETIGISSTLGRLSNTVSMTPKAEDLCVFVQTAQDDLNPWGSSLDDGISAANYAWTDDFERRWTRESEGWENM